MSTADAFCVTKVEVAKSGLPPLHWPTWILRFLRKKNPRCVRRETAQQRLADSEILGLCDPRRPRDKNDLKIDHRSPRLIALLARSADSWATSLTAGKNVAGFAPIGGAVGGASLVDLSDRRLEKGAALSRNSPKRVI
jgi:hypothetical protein